MTSQVGTARLHQVSPAGLQGSTARESRCATDLRLTRWSALSTVLQSQSIISPIACRSSRPGRATARATRGPRARRQARDQRAQLLGGDDLVDRVPVVEPGSTSSSVGSDPLAPAGVAEKDT